jgi:D-amino-acid dehydrogenase
MTSQNYDVIVVGGGVVGASAGYHLARLGAKTLLIDRRDAGRASDAGAGILAPEINRRDPQAWFDFAVPAVQYYPDLMAQLRELRPADAPVDTGYAQPGIMLVAASPEEIEPFETAQAEILTRRDQRGTPAPEDLHPITAQEARELFPALGHVHRALYYRHGARVDGRLLNTALLEGARAHGLEESSDSVSELVMDGDSISAVASGPLHVTGVRTGAQTIGAGTVIIAGGAWSATFGKQLGHEIPVTPQRGQIAHLLLAGTNTDPWPVVNAFRGHYLVAWPNGRVAAGATRETGSGFEPVTSVAGIQEVLHEAVRVAPGLAPAQLLEVRVGLRPMPPDGLPVLGAIPGIEGVLVATGHGPTGLQLGPYSGKIVTEMALGKSPTAPIDAFSITRFGQPGM